MYGGALYLMIRFAFAAALLCQAGFAAPALMPLPQKVEQAAGKLPVDGTFSVAATAWSDARLERVLDRFVARLSRQTGIPLLSAHAADPSHAALRVECAAAGPDYPTLGEDESYTLAVAADGALLKAPALAGVRHGLETFAQLVTPGAEGFEAPAVRIEDRPRFAWRGLMLDVSRHWMPPVVVKRNLDAMAAAKLNVFHWHLSDDQGFRVESKRYPRLQELGSDGNFYTQDQIREIVAYARERGIRVVPEFDMPGHTTSWLPGYPDLGAQPGPYSIGRTWGIFDPVLDPTREETYEFLDGLIGEMAALFPDPYFHVGGDEVNGKDWQKSAKIQAFLKQHKLADNHALQAYFNQRLIRIVEKNGKIMVGWDEVLHPDLPKATVIQSWRGQNGLADAVAAGHRAILSWGYYLDHMRPASYHYGIDPTAGAASKLTPEQASRILGGEACMWTEYASAETVDSRIWPRAAAVAERFWSSKDVTDVDSMYARMETVSRLLDWTGVTHRTGYQPMLDRMAAGRPDEALRILADAVEAQGLGPRARARKYTSLVPLNRLVDAARPECETVRLMEQAATRLAAGGAPDSADARMLREQFARWAANHARFEALAGRNALLSEDLPLSKDLSAAGALGIQLLDYLANPAKPPAAWLDEQAKELARMQKVNVEVILAAPRPVKVLLDEVAKRAR